MIDTALFCGILLAAVALALQGFGCFLMLAVPSETLRQKQLFIITESIFCVVAASALWWVGAFLLGYYASRHH